ncbi:MAG: DUF4837 family protein [Flavobacteriaceae bacterium]
MRKIIIVLFVSSFLISCGGGDSYVLPSSVGKINKVLVVIKGSLWTGEVGDEIRNSLGELQVGLPQPEAVISLSQVAPNGFSSMMRVSRNVLIIEEGEKENVNSLKNKYASPQTVVYLSAKDKEGIKKLIKEKAKEIISIFREADIVETQKLFQKKRLDDSKYKTLSNLKISLTIPKEFKTVDDTGEFLWLRQHLRSGIAKGAGNNNILVYSLPLTEAVRNSDNLSKMRDSIGEKYIPGAREGMYMITEKAYTPHTYNIDLKGFKTFETRGKWEVKDAWMAGPFVNYAMIDEKNKRLIVVEGFTYAPSVGKREFLFELEAIAKSIVVK